MTSKKLLPLRCMVRGRRVWRQGRKLYRRWFGYEPPQRHVVVSRLRRHAEWASECSS